MQERPVATSFFVERHAEQRLVGVTSESVFVSAVLGAGPSENAARFRYIFNGGERHHFPVSGLVLVELDRFGAERRRHPDLIVHRVVRRGTIGVFWHGPARPGHLENRIGAHGWDLATHRQLWSFAQGLVGIDDDWVLGKTGQGYVLAEVATGTRRVAVEGQELVAMATDDERLYVLDRGRAVAAYRLDGSTRAWASEPAKAPTLTCFGLAIADGFLWYASNEGAIALDLATGAIAKTIAMPEYFRAVVTTDLGAVAVRETKIDRLTASGAERIATVSMKRRKAFSDGATLVAIHEHDATKDLLFVSRGATTLLKLAEPSPVVVLGGGYVATQSARGAFAVATIEELTSPKAKTIAFPDGQVFAKKAALPKVKASAPALRLFETLEGVGLLGKMDSHHRTMLLLDLFGDEGELDESSAARLLQAAGPPARAFISHDWRFGQETDDVIAEFDRAIDDARLRLEQTKNDASGLTMRATIAREDGADVVEERSFASDVSLVEIADAIASLCERARTERRVHALQTDGDWSAFLVAAPSMIEALRAAKVQGIP